MEMCMVHHQRDDLVVPPSYLSQAIYSAKLLHIT